MSTALKTKMNTEVKEKWIAALRSGKYEQGSQKLRSVTGYCCLGVLCDLYSQEHNQEWEFRGYDEIAYQTTDYWYFDEQSEFLPETVMEWAGFSLPSPQVKMYHEEEDFFYKDDIANLNDSGYTFNALADLIEEQL